MSDFRKGKTIGKGVKKRTLRKEDEFDRLPRRDQKNSLIVIGTGKAIDQYARPEPVEVDQDKLKAEGAHLAHGVYSKTEKDGEGYFTTVMFQGKAYKFPTDKDGFYPEVILAKRFLDVEDGSRDGGHLRSVGIDIAEDAKEMYTEKDKPGIYHWYLHPNESDIVGIDDGNSRAFEIVSGSNQKAPPRKVLIIGGKPEDRENLAKVLKESFTVAEQKLLAGTLIQIGGIEDAAGVYIQRTDLKGNAVGAPEIRINSRYVKDSSVIIHEAIHHMRARDTSRPKEMQATENYVGTDADLEEAMTEAETVAREKPLTMQNSNAGYYHALKEVKSSQKTHKDAVVEDRKSLNVKKGTDDPILKGARGKKAVKNVDQHFPETHISKLKIKGKAEAIDRFIEVKEGKSKAQIQAYSPEGKDTLPEIAQGADSVSEWQDGKKKEVKK